MAYVDGQYTRGSGDEATPDAPVSASRGAYPDNGSSSDYSQSRDVPATPENLVTGELINGSARDTQAALSRADWNDYKTRFFPLEDELISRYNNEGLRNQAMSESADAVNTAFDTNEGVQQRRLSRYGTSLAPDQQAALNRDNNVARVATLTDTRNLTRDTYADLDEQILSGSASSTQSVASGS